MCSSDLTISDLTETREPQLLAGIVSDLRVINGQRGRVALFKLDDKSGVVEARADEALLTSNRQLLKDDEFIVVRGLVKPDRFSGGLQLSVAQVWSLAQARCRFGKYLRVHMNSAYGERSTDMARLFKIYPPQAEQTEGGESWQGLGVRVTAQCHRGQEQATAELQLDERARFFPSDAALASWWALAAPGRAEIVYE